MGIKERKTYRESVHKMNIKIYRCIYLAVAVSAMVGICVLVIGKVRSTSLEDKIVPSGLVPVSNPIDFGKIEQGTVDGTFELVNRASDPTRIVQVDKSCRCTEVEISKFEIPSGESTKIRFRWDTSSGRGIRGSDFTIFYTVVGQEGIFQTHLDIRGDILPFFEIVPNSLIFDKDKAETKIIRLIPRKKDVTIQNVNTTFPALKVEKTSLHEVSVSYYPEKFEADPYQHPYFTITTDCPTEPSYTIFPKIR
ncbi:MAG: DUF1573 domain-containing protein [Planctomycetaceae bacterium]|nr:DUF1573 domain-containing protein [Planctomycetaceae bacterium]